MQIISKIEVNYFRSIYSVTLSKNNDINVLIGGNDSGKSNILKALNLFFNNATELSTPFNFFDDLSRLREKEARTAKGRASVWIKVTFNNFLNWKSLPKEFTIKKSWNRYDDRPTVDYPQELTQTTVGRFLNKLSFHYIPAVRGRDIFAHYLNALHDALIEDEKAGVKDASTQLMTSINQSTNDMSERIKSGLNIDSNIQVPKDLRELFSALDFSTRFSGYDIPLQKRGDGIQARHIPFVLDFIARHSSKHHIWAYEEPENSLELSKAFELAEQFEKDFSKENQIYLTTHSPAFYDLAGTHVNKWIVRSSCPHAGENLNEFTTQAEPVGASEIADESLGIAALISSRAKELYQKINSLNTTKEILEKKISLASRMQVIVEGETDKKILETAYSKLFPAAEPSCEFVSAEGCNNVTYFLKVHKTLAKTHTFPIVGLYDNDHAGRGEVHEFKNHKNLDGHISFKEISLEKRLYCGLLPIANELSLIAEGVSKKIAGHFDVPMTIEFMFPSEVINKAIDSGVLILEARKTVAKDSELSMPINLSDELSKNIPDGYKHLAYVVADSSKKHFSQWIGQLEMKDFVYFQPLFESLSHLSVVHQN